MKFTPPYAAQSWSCIPHCNSIIIIVYLRLIHQQGQNTEKRKHSLLSLFTSTSCAFLATYIYEVNTTRILHNPTQSCLLHEVLAFRVSMHRVQQLTPQWRLPTSPQKHQLVFQSGCWYLKPNDLFWMFVNKVRHCIQKLQSNLEAALQRSLLLTDDVCLFKQKWVNKTTEKDVEWTCEYLPSLISPGETIQRSSKFSACIATWWGLDSRGYTAICTSTNGETAILKTCASIGVIHVAFSFSLEVTATTTRWGRYDLKDG